MRSAVLFAVAVVLAVVGTAVIGTSEAWGLFTGSPVATMSVTTRTLAAPASLTATASGHDVHLTWPAANGTGYAVSGAANGTSSNCASTTLSALTTTTSLAYTDTGRSTPPGSWYCYHVASTAGSWTSQQSNPLTAAQLGFVISGVTEANAVNTSGCGGSGFGVAGTLDCGDQFVVTFSQPVNPATGPPATDNVCIDQTVKIVYLAATGTGQCAANQAYDLLKLTGIPTGSKKSRYAATFTWNTADTTLTVLVGLRSSGTSDLAATGVLTVAPTTNASMLKSTTGAFGICTANVNTGDNCIPVPTGSV